MDLLNKILPAAKAWAALVGAILATVLATVTPDDPIYKVLALAAAIATAIATYAIPNVPNVRGFEPDEFGDEGVADEDVF